MATIHYVRQREAKGLGHAVSVARQHVGDQPFAVLLPDDLMMRPVLGGMLEVHQRTGRPVLALMEVGPDEISAYGCAAVERTDDGLVRVTDLVEKPDRDEAPSNLAVMGRYILTADIFPAIEAVPPGKGGEIQVTDALAALLDEGVYGYTFAEGRYDTGNKLDYLQDDRGVRPRPRRPRPRLPGLPPRRRRAHLGVIPLASATARILASVDRLHPRAIPLDDALGCVTSIALRADAAVPPFANTAMDGFALRAADSAGPPVRLKIVGTLPAGHDPAGLHVGPGEAVRIMTGAPLPEGADSIVMVERTNLVDDDTVEVEIQVPVGNHVRPAGEDLQPGQEVFPAFTVLTAGHLGVLASLGLRKVPVFPRARVGVLSTGDELVDGPDELRPGQIRDSNRHTLLALLREAGCEPVDLGLVRDDLDAVRAAVRDGLAGCHALVTSGGVSMGDFDEVKKVLVELGAGDDAWMQVAIKPAKPLAFAVIDDKPVFGLPGNPASSMVSFELFARPALRQMMGHPEPRRRRVAAVADEGLDRSPDGKLHLIRVVAAFADDGRVHVRSSGGQGSNLLGSMARANALAFVPDGNGIAAGGDVQALLLTYP